MAAHNTPYVHKSVDGIVLTVEDRQTATGVLFVKARIQDDAGKIWLCTLWDAQATSFMARGLLNQRVYVEGGLKEDNAVNVKFFDGKAHVAAKPVETKHYEPTTELVDQGKHVMRTIWRDYRGVRTYKNDHKNQFVRVNSAWERKIDYCLRIMGASEVMSWLREFKVDGRPGGVLVGSADYKEKLALMIETCQQHTGDYLEFYEEPVCENI